MRRTFIPGPPSSYLLPGCSLGDYLSGLGPCVCMCLYYFYCLDVVCALLLFILLFYYVSPLFCWKKVILILILIILKSPRRKLWCHMWADLTYFCTKHPVLIYILLSTYSCRILSSMFRQNRQNCHWIQMNGNKFV